MLGIPVGRLQSITWVVAGVLSFVSIFFQATILGLPLDPTYGLTALVTALGLLPLAIGSGEAGREIEGPMAVVILGGLITSTLLNLLVLPTLAVRYGRFDATDGAVDSRGAGTL